MPALRLSPPHAPYLEGVRSVSGEYVILRKEEYEQLINALQRAVELAERYAALARKRKRGERK